MRKTLIALVVAACAVAGLAGCAKSPYPSTWGPAATSSTAAPANQAEAYLAVLQHLYGADTGLNGDATFLALDLSQVQLADTAPLVALVRRFCADHGYTLLLDTFEGLQAKGYIKDLGFPDGFLISYTDVSLTADQLVTKAHKWRSGLGAIGGQYTVTRGAGGWSITSITGQWIS